MDFVRLYGGLLCIHAMITHATIVIDKTYVTWQLHVCSRIVLCGCYDLWSCAWMPKVRIADLLWPHVFLHLLLVPARGRAAGFLFLPALGPGGAWQYLSFANCSRGANFVHRHVGPVTPMGAC